MSKQLFTIGYAGAEIEAFIAKLSEASVETLIDVREIPLSRKRGFSKNALKAMLGDAGIAYEHFRQLGSPSSLRHTVRETEDFETFFNGVRQHLATDSAQAQVGVAVDAAQNNRAALMCYCADWRRCHRRCVVDEFLHHGEFVVTHLIVTETDEHF